MTGLWTQKTTADPGAPAASSLPVAPKAETETLLRVLPLFSALMPMFLWLDAQGRIAAIGRTLHKTIGGGNAIGLPFTHFFALGRSEEAARTCSLDMQAVCGHSGCAKQRESCSRVVQVLTRTRMPHLTLRARPDIDLRGEVVPLDPREGGGLLINLSFGIHLREAVSELDLTEHDFSAADLAMEMLYLQEAQSLVMEELRALTQRLDGARREAETLALTDPLTRLANRRAMERALSSAVENAADQQNGFGLMQIDLDHFKAVNDTFGHAAGDYVLQCVARELRETVRNGDLIGRMGGDEFQILLRGPVERARMEELAWRIIERLEMPKWYSGQECRISGSIGIALSQEYSEINIATLQGDVDRATYAAKETGRGCVRFSTPKGD